MKVHQITEAPRVEPKLSLGNLPGSAPSGPTLSAPKTSAQPKSVDIKPGILDSKGNRMFNVVDENGKTLKKFSGPNAEADANEHRDKLKKQIKAAKPKSTRPPLTGDPKKDLNQPKADIDKPKPQSKFTKLFKGSIVGTFLGIGIGTASFLDVLAKYEKVLKLNAYNTAHPDVEKARGEVAVDLAATMANILGGAAAGALAATKATRILILIPGWGWLGALISGGVGFIAVAALQALATDTGAMNIAAEFMMKRVDHALLKNITDDVEEKVDTKGAMKQAIMSNPELMKAFKLAKKMKATKAAS